MFSELVDEVASLSGRPNRKPDITRYVNSTIRECCVKQLWSRNLIEDQFAVTAVPATLDRPTLLRHFRTVNYNGCVYPKFIEPGRKQDEFDHYYYAGTTYFVFAGVAVGDTVNYAYYTNLKHLIYYDDTAGNERPAIYDKEAETWTYWDGGAYVSALGSDALDLAARDKVTNWLLDNWESVIIEGALAKIFKIMKDDRQLASYALYKSMQNDLESGEQFASSGF